MAKFEKEVLTPGVYFKGGEQIVVTEQDCRDYFASLEALRSADLDVPLMYEHSEPGIPLGEGAPGVYDLASGEVLLESSDDLRAERLKRTVGKVLLNSPGNRINERGAVVLTFDVPVESAAQQLASGLIRHVSAELRPHWTDGKGREYSKVFGHFALTHRPIQVDQEAGFTQLSGKSVMLSESAAVVRLSADELLETSMSKVPVGKISKAQVAAFLSQFADDEDEDGDDEEKKKAPAESDGGEDGGKGEGEAMTPPAVQEAAAAVNEAVESVAQEPEKNPDMPADDAGRKTMEALLAHLGKMGLPLQADTTAENLAERLLTAVMTYNAVKDQAATESEGSDKGVPVTEESGAIAQMSEVDTASARARLVQRINRMRDGLMLTPAAADRLRPIAATVQFSADGQDRVGLTRVLDAFEGSLGMLSGVLDDKTSNYQLSSSGEAIEINPPGFVVGGAIMPGDRRADEMASDVLSRHPGFRRK